MDLVEEYILNIKKGKKSEDIIHKNEINIKYKSYEGGVEKIFGNDFVENNKNNITLIINGIQSLLIDKYNLKKGTNNVTICIKKKLTIYHICFVFVIVYIILMN